MNLARSYPAGRASIELVQGDITAQQVDAIVNAANASLAGGGGVDGAIHRAAGWEKLQGACRQIGQCPTGSAVITPGFDLSASFIIHAVGPVWHGGAMGEPELLRSAYRSSFELAAGEKLASIACPAISTGVYGYPMDQAAEIALRAASDHLAAGSTLRLVRFVLFDSPAYQAFVTAAERLLSQGPR